MVDYITRDSDNRIDFETGSKRDTNEGKWRIDLIWVGFLIRLAALLARGAKKYGEWNWSKGQPISRSYESALRHLIMWKAGDREEDHLAAVAFNIMSIMFAVDKVREGKLPISLLQIDGQWFECADTPTEETNS